MLSTLFEYFKNSFDFFIYYNFGGARNEFWRKFENPLIGEKDITQKELTRQLNIALSTLGSYV